MKSVNLLSQGRRLARDRVSRTSKWGLALACYVVLLASGYFSAVRLVKADLRPLDERERTLSAQIDAGNKACEKLSQQLQQAGQKLRTAEAIGQQPDWSLLLSLLSQQTSDNIVLDFCRLRRAPSVPAASPPAAPAGDASAARQTGGPMVLEVNGVAKAQSDISEYVLRLEKSGLFDEVKLMKTGARSYLGRDTTAFSLECSFGKTEGETP